MSPRKNEKKTPRSQVRSALRQAWLRSRERQYTLKRDGYCCQECGVKQSKAKGKEQPVVVHHMDEIDWDDLLTLVYERLLHEPERLETLCPGCHDARHEG